MLGYRKETVRNLFAEIGNLGEATGNSAEVGCLAEVGEALAEVEAHQEEVEVVDRLEDVVEDRLAGVEKEVRVEAVVEEM